MALASAGARAGRLIASVLRPLAKLSLRPARALQHSYTRGKEAPVAAALVGNRLSVLPQPGLPLVRPGAADEAPQEQQPRRVAGG